MRLIDADELMEQKPFTLFVGYISHWGKAYNECARKAREAVRQAPTMDAVFLPCKVGDEVWCFRDTRVYNKPIKGTVTEIYFRDNMDMCIVVRRLCRGRWGERVFATEQEAQAAIDRRLNDGKM